MRKVLTLGLTVVIALTGGPVGAIATAMAVAPGVMVSVAAGLPSYFEVAPAGVPDEDDFGDDFEEQGPDGIRNARRLGGRTSFQRPGLGDIETLRRMMARAGVPDDIRKVLSDAGIVNESGPSGAVVDTVVAAMTSWPTSNTPSASIASCDAMSLEEGVVRECDVHRGTVMQWMAYRPKAPKDLTPGLLERVRWAGAKPFRAFIFNVSSASKVYTFIVPKACGNLALLNVAEIPPPPPVAVRPQPAPAPAPAQTPPPAPTQTSTLEGVARDAAGQPLPGAQVVLRNAQGQIVATTTTNNLGQYVFSALPQGTYTVELVNAAGAILGASAPVAVAAGVTATTAVTATAVSAIAVAGGAAAGGILGFLTTGTFLALAGAAAVVGIVAVRAGDDASPSR